MDLVLLSIAWARDPNLISLKSVVLSNGVSTINLPELDNKLPISSPELLLS